MSLGAPAFRVRTLGLGFAYLGLFLGVLHSFGVYYLYLVVPALLVAALLTWVGHG